MDVPEPMEKALEMLEGIAQGMAGGDREAAAMAMVITIVVAEAKEELATLRAYDAVVGRSVLKRYADKMAEA